MFELDFTSPKRLFLSIIKPVTFDDFFSLYWEEKPLHIRRSVGPIGSAGLLSLSHRSLRTLVKNHCLQSGRDIDIFRCSSSGKKESLNEKGTVSLTKFDRLVTGGRASAVFHELQRYKDELWQLIELLESFFGTLVGSRVCVRPTGAQQSPATYQHSDSEIFIIQTEGESSWQLFPPLTPLSRTESESVENPGEPTQELLLRVGDLLYLPRGTVHRNSAIATNTHASYLTLYTYQHVSWGDYLQSVFPSLIKEAMDSDIDFRRGLPINFIKSTKLSKSSKVQSVVGILLLKLAKFRSNTFPLPRDMMEKFMCKRLPPFRADPVLRQSFIPEGAPPDLSCKVRLKYPEHLCFLVVDKELECERELLYLNLSYNGEDVNLDDSTTSQPHFLSQSLTVTGETQVLLVFSSVLNSRKNHMIFGTKPQSEHVSVALMFPVHFLTSLERLKASSEQFMPAASLPLDDPTDREELIRSLWSRHLLECIPCFRGQPCKSTKLD